MEDQWGELSLVTTLGREGRPCPVVRLREGMESDSEVGPVADRRVLVLLGWKLVQRIETRGFGTRDHVGGELWRTSLDVAIDVDSLATRRESWIRDARIYAVH